MFLNPCEVASKVGSIKREGGKGRERRKKRRRRNLCRCIRKNQTTGTAVRDEVGEAIVDSE
jgi:hypothetical protein